MQVKYAPLASHYNIQHACHVPSCRYMAQPLDRPCDLHQSKHASDQRVALLVEGVDDYAYAAVLSM